MIAWKIYKFTTVDQAVAVMMADPETGKHLHKFISDANQNCQICLHSVGDHISLEDPVNLDNQHLEEKIPLTKKLMNVNYIEIESSSKRQSPVPRRLSSIKIQTLIPKQTLDDFEDSSICHICFSNKLTNDNKQSLSCHHEFCNECVSKYLKWNIDNGKVLSIKCLYGGCTKKYTNHEIKLNVDEKTYSKFLKFLSRKTKLMEEGMLAINCPYPDCDEIISTDPLLNELFMQCGNNHKFCAKCKSLGWHQNGKCEQYSNTLLKQIVQKNKIQGGNYKQCPKCKVLIEKNEGCNAMKCIGCGYQFCWLCERHYEDDHFAIYNFRGCPGMRYHRKGGNKCKRNGCVKCLCYFGSCLLCIIGMIFVLIFYIFFGCCYEFVKCYLNKKPEENEDDSGDFELAPVKAGKNVEKRKCECGCVVICVILVLLGLLLQPFYLLFYIMFGILQCYRRFGLWALMGASGS